MPYYRTGYLAARSILKPQKVQKQPFTFAQKEYHESLRPLPSDDQRTCSHIEILLPYSINI